MVWLQKRLEASPLSTCLLLVAVAIGALFITKVYMGNETILFNWPRLIVVNTVSFFCILFLLRSGWAKEAGLTTPVSEWRRHWLWVMLPMLALALLNFVFTDLSLVEFSPVRVSAWLLFNVSTGVFEEVLMRGVCFYALYRAWGRGRSGVFKAAIAQALIFGLAHLTNLYHEPAMNVIAQVIYATLIGFGFAGLVYFVGSIWPAVIVHTAINSAGTVNYYLIEGYNNVSEITVMSMMVVIVLFVLFAALPGALCLRKAAA